MTDFLFAIRAPRNYRLDAEFSEESAKAVAVITFIGEQLFDAGNEANASFGLRAVGSVPGRQNKNPRTTKLINDRMNLAVSAAFGQADSLNLRPPFPPPAQR